MEPIARPRAHQNLFALGNGSQERLAWFAVAVIPQCRSNSMLVHRKRQRRGTAAVSEAANKGASLTVEKTATPEFLRHEYRKQLRGPHLSIIFGNEFIVVVAGVGTLRK
jgi:hypothetical protein